MNLNNEQDIKKLDTHKVAESIAALPDQIAQVISDFKKVKLTGNYKNIRQIIVSGMGGSNLGARIIQSALIDRLKVPVEIVAGYEVPASVNHNTLFIMSSYSGGTEETLATFTQAKKKGAQIIAITAGGALAKLMNAQRIPGYIFKHKFNPSDQPRLGLGYSIFGILMLLAKTGLINMKASEANTIIDSLRKQNLKLIPKTNTKINLAKKTAVKLFGQMPILVAPDFLAGNLHALRNQFCETSKNFASFLVLPDLNHFALEGLSHPKENKKGLVFLFFKSALAHPRIQLRSKITKKIIKQNGLETHAIKLTNTTRLAQAFELLQLGTWITYYLGMLNEVDPVKIPFVDWFKKELEKQS